MKSLFDIRLIDIKLGAYRFNPGVFTSLVTLCLLYLLISLGQWQLFKAEYKDSLQQKILARKDLTPVSMQELPHTDEDRVFIPVITEGNYDNQHQLLLDNRIIGGRAGFDVYTPLLMPDGQHILVNRGWVPQGRTRDMLPQINAPEQALKIRGLLDAAPSRGVLLASNVHSQVKWPMVLQYIDFDEIESMLGYPLFKLILRLDASEEYGYHRELPALNLNSAKNRGYAFQWFAMAIALLIIYFVVNTKKSTRKSSEKNGA